MSLSIYLPQTPGSRQEYTLREPGVFTVPARPPKSRVAFAAAHVVCDPLVTTSLTAPAQLDWDATLAYRRHLWFHGLAVAEAMDTSQRGMGLNWNVAQE